MKETTQAEQVINNLVKRFEEMMDEAMRQSEKKLFKDYAYLHENARELQVLIMGNRNVEEMQRVILNQEDLILYVIELTETNPEQFNSPQNAVCRKVDQLIKSLLNEALDIAEAQKEKAEEERAALIQKNEDSILEKMNQLMKSK